jgi:hypothetical protein
MGYSTAWDFAEHLPLEQAVRAHFESNCYPPFHPNFVPLAMAAIAAAANGEWTRLLLTPNAHYVSAKEAVEHYRLNAFVDYVVAANLEAE